MNNNDLKEPQKSTPISLPIQEIKNKKTPMPITIINIIFGVGTIFILIIGATAILFSDSSSGQNTSIGMAAIAAYYPFVTLLSIIMSRRTNSYVWAFLPLIFIFVYPIVTAFNPRFFAAPINLIFKAIVGRNLF